MGVVGIAALLEGAGIKFSGNDVTSLRDNEKSSLTTIVNEPNRVERKGIEPSTSRMPF